MTYGNASYYPTNCNYPAYRMQGQFPQQLQQQQQPQQQGGFMDMPSGPSFLTPVLPLGAGQQFQVREESFIENILRFNRGKIGTFYFTYQGNSRWNAMVYKGRVETAGRDHIIISDAETGKRYLLLMANLDWVEFEERINYPHQEINPDIQMDMSE